ncbi:MAG TPA: MBL fold metallo-hydrolase [Steroidobacteraceae bacterium]|nr:MBL fold metallo-hydrolase [Steroidobacteraceae bacterium]
MSLWNTSRALALGAVVAASLMACSKGETPQPVADPPAAPAVAETPPPAPPQEEGAHAFKIGELSAWAVRDGALEFPNDNKIFGLGKTPDEVNALLTAASLPTDKLQLGLQPLLVKTADKVLLFDTGAAANFGPGNGKIQASLAEAGFQPADVTDIFISHLHGDHVGGLVNADGALAFPNATVHLSKAEWKFLQEVKQDIANQMGLEKRDALVAAIKPKVEAFAPGAELVKGNVKAVNIKGHTPGHSGYEITSGAEKLLYVGDSMHHFVISVQRPDWPMAFDADQKVGAKSRADLIAELAKSGERVYAVHFPWPGIGKVQKAGDGAVWVGE